MRIAETSECNIFFFEFYVFFFATMHEKYNQEEFFFCWRGNKRRVDDGAMSLDILKARVHRDSVDGNHGWRKNKFQVACN